MNSTRSSFLKSHQAKAQSELLILKQKAKILSISRTSVIILLLGFSYWAMQEAGGPQYFWSLAIGMPIFLFLVKRHVNTQKSLAHCNAYLKIIAIELDYLEGSLSRSASAIRAPKNHNYARELDLLGPGSLHHHIDKTFTSSGAAALSQTILDPPYTEWKERQDYFSELAKDENWLLHYQASGDQIEDKPNLKRHLEAWSKEEFSAFPLIYWALIPIGIVTVFFMLWRLIQDPSTSNSQFFLYAFLFNLILLGSRAKPMRAQHQKLTAVSGILEAFAALIHKIEEKKFSSSYGQNFKKQYHLGAEAIANLQRLSKLLASLDQASNAVVLVIMNGFFCYHLFRFKALEKWHKKQAAELPFWLEGLYQFEAHLSLATYNLNHADFHWPQLSNKRELSAKQMGHPIISAENRVSNDLIFDPQKYIILTGSNMSGKSTFLRTVGVNLVLAQMGLKVAAQNFVSYPFQLLSSMNPQDDLKEETSYFQAEIIRLKTLIDQLDSGRFSFFLLDEILRGTNSNDKQDGTRSFLKKIESAEAWGVIATHDVDIAHMADDNLNFKAAYFESKVKGEDLLFDYKLREGICKTPNASLLMKRYGLLA